jgi:hypothetical protein
MNDTELLDALADRVVSRLNARGLISSGPGKAGGVHDDGPAPPKDEEYDANTCIRFLSPMHVGDNVLKRADYFFGELASRGEVTSPEVVSALGLKGGRSIPANLTIPLKKSVWRMGLEEPWEGDETPDGFTIWRDRDGIAGRMSKAINAERARRKI